MLYRVTMFLCKTCNKNIKSRVDYMIHISKCNSAPQESTCSRNQQLLSSRHRPRPNLQCADEESSTEDDDSDADPTWEPTPEASDFYIQGNNTPGSSPVTFEQQEIAAQVDYVLDDDYDVPKEMNDPEEKPEKDQPAKKMKISEKLHNIHNQIEKWKDKKKKAMRLGHSSKARRIANNINKLKNLVSEDTMTTSNKALLNKERGTWALKSTPKGKHKYVQWQNSDPDEGTDTRNIIAAEVHNEKKESLTNDLPIINTNEDVNIDAENVNDTLSRTKQSCCIQFNEVVEDVQDDVDLESVEGVQDDVDLESVVSQKETTGQDKLNLTICPFCGWCKPTSNNFTRHLKALHSDQPTVKTMMELMSKPHSRREVQKITSSLRKLGRFNYASVHGNSRVLPCKKSKKISEIVTCNFCLGGYNRLSFRHHWRTCPQRDVTSAINEDVPKNNLNITPKKSKSYCSLPPDIKIDKKLLKAKNLIFENMNMTAAGKQALEDELIVKFAAERMPGVQGDRGKLDYFRQGVRDLSNLLTEIKKIDPSITSLKDCFICIKFDTIMKAVHNLSETDYISGTVGKTSFNFRLRNPIGLCCKILLSDVKAQLSGKDRDDRIRELQYFLEELESRWPRNFGSLAEKQSKENRHGKVVQCADPEDIALVFNSCNDQLDKATQVLTDVPTTANYDSLMRLLALSMYTTSRRRSCDLQKLTVSDFQALEKNRELCEKVSKYQNFSKEMVKSMSELYCIFSCGKDQMSTAILLTEKMKNAIECLLSIRNKYKIHANRVFVKLDPKETPWKVDNALEWAKKVFPLKDPKNFGVHGLRHFTGTVGQLLTGDDPQVESIFREGLSHSERVSKLHYRGNIATRLIHGYGIPLLNQMKKLPTTSTTTTNEPNEHQRSISALEMHPSNSSEQHIEKTVCSVNENENDPDYTPDSEEDEDDRNSTKNSEFTLQTIYNKKQVVRKLWSEEEDTAIIRQFYKTIKMEGKLSRAAIDKAKKSEPPLRNRTEAQIRARISQVRLKASSKCADLSNIVSKLSSPEAKEYGKNLSRFKHSKKDKVLV